MLGIRNIIIFRLADIVMKKDMISVVKNSKVTHQIMVAATKGNRYWTDFLKVDEDYKNNLSEQDYIRFLEKSQLDCEISMAQYLQFSSEVTIVDYIIRNYSGFKNEPKYNGKKNTECSFEYESRTINIEVKCPDLSKRIEQENSEGVNLFAAERFPSKDSFDQAKNFIGSNIRAGQSMQNLDRLDNKLKDYLISAHKKFPTSNSSNFNVLVVALDIIQDMDEWYSYLFGDNGAFTDRTYIVDDYSNVDAVMLTNVQHGHMADDIDLSINCWNLENYVSLLFLNPQKENCHGLGEYYMNSALNLFGGMTRNFLSFQQKLDEKNIRREQEIKKQNSNKNQNKALSHIFYMEDKLIDLRIISEWVETLNKV